MPGDLCAQSQRVDGQLHSWRFDGDSPYIVCVFCNEMRDAISGAVLRPVEPIMTITSKDIDTQRAWSDQTFGPGLRTGGVTAHIASELEEIRKAPTDLSEWVDVLILAIDGATRAGHSGIDLIAAYHAKVAKNRARTWPDWRQFTEDQPIEHDRAVPDAR